MLNQNNFRELQNQSKEPAEDVLRTNFSEIFRKIFFFKKLHSDVCLDSEHTSAVYGCFCFMGGSLLDQVRGGNTYPQKQPYTSVLQTILNIFTRLKKTPFCRNLIFNKINSKVIHPKYFPVTFTKFFRTTRHRAPPGDC